MKFLPVAGSLMAGFVLTACGGKTYTTNDAVVVKRGEGAVRQDIQAHKPQQGGENIRIRSVDCKPVSKTLMQCSARVSAPTAPQYGGLLRYRATVNKDNGHVSVVSQGHPSGSP